MLPVTPETYIQMGRVGVEPTVTLKAVGFTVRCVCRFATYPNNDKIIAFSVTPAGLEPGIPALKGQCPHLLDYGALNFMLPLK